MSIYAVAVHHYLHTCPASAEPHPIDTRRTLVHVTPGRPCTRPVIIRCGAVSVTVPCGRHEPVDQQCGSCRTMVTVVSVTITDLGYQPVSAAGEDSA